MLGNLTAAREMSENSPKVGEISGSAREKNLVGGNCFMLTSHLGPYRCLVALCMIIMLLDMM